MIATKAQIAALAALTGGRAIPATTPFDIEQKTTLGVLHVEHVDGRRWTIDTAGKTDRVELARARGNPDLSGEPRTDDPLWQRLTD